MKSSNATTTQVRTPIFRRTTEVISRSVGNTSDIVTEMYGFYDKAIAISRYAQKELLQSFRSYVEKQTLRAEVSKPSKFYHMNLSFRYGIQAGRLAPIHQIGVSALALAIQLWMWETIFMAAHFFESNRHSSQNHLNTLGNPEESLWLSSSLD